MTKEVSDNEYMLIAYLKQMEKWDEILTEMRVKPSGIAGEIKDGSKSDDYVEVEKVGFPKEGGVLTVYKGEAYPKKGFADQYALQELDKVKRLSIILLYFVSKYWWAIALTPWVVKPFIRFYAKSCRQFLKKYQLKEERYCDCVREFRRVMLNAGVDRNIVDIASLVLEYDDAYRYRFQFAARYISNSDGPFSLMEKMLRVLKERERSDSSQKEWRILYRWRWVFSFVFRKEIRRVLDGVVLDRITPSPEDWYWMGYKNNFDYSV